MAYREMFFIGKVAMMPQGTWLLGDLKDIDKYPHDFETTFASLPRLTKDQTPNATIGSGGRGHGDPSGFELIKEFADKVGGVVG